MSDSCDPMDCSPPGSSVYGDSPGKNIRVGCHALLRGNLSNPGSEPRSPTLQVVSLPSEPSGTPKNTGVGSLSLLQGIVLTQESNSGLLHCRQILYQLSYPGNPIFHQYTPKFFCLWKDSISGSVISLGSLDYFSLSNCFEVDILGILTSVPLSFLYGILPTFITVKNKLYL